MHFQILLVNHQKILQHHVAGIDLVLGTIKRQNVVAMIGTQRWQRHDMISHSSVVSGAEGLNHWYNTNVEPIRCNSSHRAV